MPGVRSLLFIIIIMALYVIIGHSELTKANTTLDPYEVVAYEHPNFRAITKSWRLNAGMRQLLVENVGEELNNNIGSIRIGEKVGVALFQEANFAGRWRTVDASTSKLSFPMRNQASSLIIYPKEAAGPLGVELEGNWRRQFFPLSELAEEPVALYPYVGDYINDRAALVRIFGGYGDIEAQFFEHVNFEGKPIILLGSESIGTNIYLGEYQMVGLISALRLIWTGSPPSECERVQPLSELISGFGTATLDGIMSPGEWDNSDCLEFEAILPPDPRLFSETVPAALCVMNDSDNIYLGVRIDHGGFSGGGVTFCFDSDNGGAQKLGGDVLQLSNTGVFVDGAFHTDCAGSPPRVLCIETDTNLGTTQDGTGAISDNGSSTFYEFSHPLHSEDINDFCLSEGDIVGFFMTLWLSTGIQPTLFIAAEARVVPVIGYRQLQIVGPD